MESVTATELEARIGARVEAPSEPKKTPPIVWWAIFGAGVLAFEAFVFGRWITGPYFENVASGPSDPPTWMKAVLTTWQAAGIPVALGFLYFLLIRPWRRERRVTTDGLLVIALFLMFFQDPLSSYFGHWFTYNAYLVNFGSWVNSVPGWVSYGEPGTMLVEPILWTGPVYVLAFFLGCWLGAWGLRKAKARWPRLGTVGLIALVLLPVMMVFDFLIEGLVFMPLGFYNYTGGHLSLFPDAYHKFPLHEAVFAGSLFAGIAALRFFKNDKGETIVERGVNQMRASTTRKALLRFLALAGAVQLIFFLTYNLPVAGWVGAHSSPWPEDIQNRSYFTNYLCGEGTDRICPQPGVPLTRGSDSARVGPDGHLSVPAEGAAAELYGMGPGESLSVSAGTELPKLVPFEDGNDGPFTGRLFGSTD